MARRKKDARQVDNFVLWKSVLISGILLGILFCLIHLFLPRFVDAAIMWHNRLLIALKVLALWLVLSSTIRAINQLRDQMPAWQLVSSGILTALFGCLISEGLLNTVRLFRAQTDLFHFDYQGLSFFTGLGLFLSVLTMINLRVKSRFLGNVLEIVVIILSLLILFYFFK